jgi:hypothetical protein
MRKSSLEGVSVAGSFSQEVTTGSREERGDEVFEAEPLEGEDSVEKTQDEGEMEKAVSEREAVEAKE